MELVDLMKRISSNDIPHFLILFGEEQTILNIYLTHILEITNAKRISADSVSYIMQNINKKRFDKSLRLYVVQDDMAFLRAEDSWETVRNTPTKDYIILRYHSLDKRSAFAKKNQQNLVEFARLSKEVLQTYISKDLPDLSEKNSSKLVEYCNYDYGRILMEIDKIKQYSSVRTDLTIDSCFVQLDKQGLFHKEIGDITFELTNAVLGGYIETAIQKLDEAKRKGEPAMMIVSILYNGFRNLLAYQGLGSNKQGAMERTGMTKGELYGCTKNVGGYSITEVKRNMLKCQEIEAGIKMGTIDEDIALEYAVLSCLAQ
jgi:DNA polymerase III delta subunit|nr:MAG TPA: DNA polymerase III, delta subunit [Caudoviricetes sp.]